MTTPTTDNDPSVQSERPIQRPQTGGILTGTAAGIAEHFDLDPTIVRLGFVALGLFGGAGLPLYLAAWLLIPEEGTNRSIASDLLDRTGIYGAPHHV
jgi:phage shock protein PspC (stress-responsive transcriptional regulator)